MLQEVELDCDNYAFLTGYLVEELLLGEGVYTIVGFDQGAVGNHAQAFFAAGGREVLLDPTIGLVVDVDLASLLAGVGVARQRMVLMYVHDDPSISLFADKVIGAIEYGDYRVSDVIYELGFP